MACATRLKTNFISCIRIAEAKKHSTGHKGKISIEHQGQRLQRYDNFVEKCRKRKLQGTQRSGRNGR